MGDDNGDEAWTSGSPGWWDAAADMLREGRITEALATIAGELPPLVLREGLPTFAVTNALMHQSASDEWRRFVRAAPNPPEGVDDPFCPTCGFGINPNLCQCGQDMNSHIDMQTHDEVHLRVPVGCRCPTDHEDAKRRIAARAIRLMERTRTAELLLAAIFDGSLQPPPCKNRSCSADQPCAACTVGTVVVNSIAVGRDASNMRIFMPYQGPSFHVQRADIVDLIRAIAVFVTRNYTSL